MRSVTASVVLTNSTIQFNFSSVSSSATISAGWLPYAWCVFGSDPGCVIDGGAKSDEGSMSGGVGSAPPCADDIAGAGECSAACCVLL